MELHGNYINGLIFYIQNIMFIYLYHQEYSVFLKYIPIFALR